VRPPQALFVPFPHGYPLHAPDQPSRRLAVLGRALNLFEDASLRSPALVKFTSV
jgi:hypothetical protein